MRTSAMIPAIILTLFIVCPTARAQTSAWGIVINGKAIHVDSSYDWNERNWGLGFEREFGPRAHWVKLALGSAFIDSESAMSYMGGGGLKRRFRLPKLGSGFYVDIGAVGFLMARKDVDAYRPFPGVLPTLTIGSTRVAVNIAYLPASAADAVAGVRRVDPGIDAMLFLQARVNPRVFAPVGMRLKTLFAGR